MIYRGVLPGLWTFQIVEAYDEQYFSVFRAAERTLVTRLPTVQGTCSRPK